MSPTSPAHRSAVAVGAAPVDGGGTGRSAVPSEFRHLPDGVRDRMAGLAGAANTGNEISPPIVDRANDTSAGTDLQSARPSVDPAGELSAALRASRPALVAVLAFSLVVNVLMLATPAFMLQVYDRVLASGSLPTLVALTGMTIVILAVAAALDIVRARVMVRVARDIDARLNERVLDASLAQALTRGRSDGTGPRELDHLRQLLSGPAPIAILDAPWTPIYLVVVMGFHPWLGVTALVGATILLTLGWAAEWRSRRPLGAALLATAESAALADSAERNAQVVTAMGMGAALRTRWRIAHEHALALQAEAADRLSTIFALTRAARLMLQIAMLAVGAWLAIAGEISAGVIIAASIMMGRALAPLEQVIAQWRSLSRGKEAMRRIDRLLIAEPPAARRLALPVPRGALSVQALAMTAPANRQTIIEGVTFAVEPGQVLAIAGPSGSGKSTLARALVGVWPLAGGEVRIDGARLDQWDAAELGRHIGYLPQEVELFAGTARDNIARFDPSATDAEVIAAAEAAGAHALILGLPKGYGTELGPFGAHLSAGQRQRVALARALFRNPPLVVLDEPNANLDRAGDEALSAALERLKSLGHTVVIVSHRVQAISRADLVLLIDRGTQRAFGPRSVVLGSLQRSSDLATVSREAAA